MKQTYIYNKVWHKVASLLPLCLFVLLPLSVAAQETIRLTDLKQGTENQISVKNLQVARTQDKTIVTMDFILDALQVPSNRYRAFTPVIKSKDGSREQRLKTLIVSGRRQNIVFERDGIDPLYAANGDRKTQKKNGGFIGNEFSSLGRFSSTKSTSLHSSWIHIKIKDYGLQHHNSRSAT